MAKSMSMFGRVKAYLNAHRREIPAICKATGLKKSWMTKVASAHIPDPGVTKIELIDEYIRSHNKSNGPSAVSQSLPSHH